MLVKRNPSSTTTYAVTGKTLAEINKDILKKGPVDPNEGKRYAGSCKGTLSLSLLPKELTYETTAGSSPVEVTATPTGGTLTLSSVITIPKLASDKGLSDAAKKEWKRFIEKTQVHEDGHADSFATVAATVAHEINHMSATGTGADEKAAQTAAAKALFAKISDAYGGSKLSDLITDDIKAYDAKTKHGATQGAVLDTSIT
jgi:predicted secreted Zn-dependent protease